jgi:hypothetical protein
MLGSKLSADSGAKTRLGFRAKLDPSIEFIHWDWHQCDKSQGSGDGIPREKSLQCCRLVSSGPLFFRFRSFVARMSPPSTSA